MKVEVGFLNCGAVVIAIPAAEFPEALLGQRMEVATAIPHDGGKDFIRIRSCDGNQHNSAVFARKAGTEDFLIRFAKSRFHGLFDGQTPFRRVECEAFLDLTPGSLGIGILIPPASQRRPAIMRGRFARAAKAAPLEMYIDDKPRLLDEVQAENEEAARRRKAGAVHNPLIDAIRAVNDIVANDPRCIVLFVSADGRRIGCDIVERFEG